MNSLANGKIQGLFKAFECLTSTYQDKFYFQGLSRQSCIFKYFSCLCEPCRGQLEQNSHPVGRNYVLNGMEGEVGVSLKKIKKSFFWGATHFHSVTTQTQAVVTIYYHCIIFLLPFNGNSMCYGQFASKLTENAITLR